MEDVRTIRFKPFTLVHDLSTFRVPSIAGSRSCLCKKSEPTWQVNYRRKLSVERRLIDSKELGIRITRKALICSRSEKIESK